MSAIKALNLKIISQDFDNTCRLILSVRLDHLDEAERRLSEAATVERIGDSDAWV